MHIFLTHHDKIQSTIDNAHFNVYFTDLSGRYLMVNCMFESLLNVGREKLLYKSPYYIFPPETVARSYVQNAKVIESGRSLSFEDKVSFYKGPLMTLQTTKFPVIDKQGATKSIGGVISNVDKSDNAKKDEEKIVNDLMDMLSRLEMSNPVVPICSACKNIRDYNGHWKQIELYISSYYKIEFSHGLCPSCSKKYYPQYF